MDPLSGALVVVNLVLIELGIAEWLGGRKDGEESKDDDASDGGPLCAS